MHSHAMRARAPRPRASSRASTLESARRGRCDGTGRRALGRVARSAKRGDGVATRAQGDVDLLNHLGKKRVVITGMGAVTAHGDDVDEMYEKLC